MERLGRIQSAVYACHFPSGTAIDIAQCHGITPSVLNAYNARWLRNRSNSHPLLPNDLHIDVRPHCRPKSLPRALEDVNVECVEYVFDARMPLTNMDPHRSSSIFCPISSRRDVHVCFV